MLEGMLILLLWDTALELEENKKKELSLGKLNLETEQRKILSPQLQQSLGESSFQSLQMVIHQIKER